MQNERLLIFGVALVAAFLAVFALVNYGVTSGFDTAGFNLINQTLNFAPLNSFFVALSEYGREFFWIPVVAILWIFGKAREKKAALILVVVFIILIILGTLLKDGYYRARPFLSLSNAIVLLPPDTDSSFPSGHALIVMGGATIALLMLKKRYSIPLLAEAILVCYSRVYVGVHYPMDVLGGAFLGAGIALLMAYVLLHSKRMMSLFDAITKFYNKVLNTLSL